MLALARNNAKQAAHVVNVVHIFFQNVVHCYKWYSFLFAVSFIHTENVVYTPCSSFISFDRAKIDEFASIFLKTHWINWRKYFRENFLFDDFFLVILMLMGGIRVAVVVRFSVVIFIFVVIRRTREPWIEIYMPWTHGAQWDANLNM